MITLKQIWEPKLAHFSYLIGASSGEAVIIDPNRDINRYLEMAAASGLRIVAILETHIHADYASGAYELSKRTGAKLYVSDTGPEEWKYEFANEAHVQPVQNGTIISVSNLRFEVVATPGHTPEHIVFALTDTDASCQPMAVFSGDFIFVGDIGRPDLLERAAGIRGTMEAGAKMLFQSIQEFASRFSDDILILPAHGAGSSCGKKLGDVPVSTLGYEKRTNWALKMESETEFVSEVLSGQPEPPAYFKEMKRINKLLPEAQFEICRRVPGDEILGMMQTGALLIDTRSAGEFAAGFIPGSINIPAGSEFLNWLGSLVDYDQKVVILASNSETIPGILAAAKLIGMEQPIAWSGAEALRAYERRHRTLAMLKQLSLEAVTAILRDSKAVPIDVRTASEFGNGHLPYSESMPLNSLRQRLSELSKGTPVLVYCAGGIRSPIAASLMRKFGLQDVSTMPAGFYDWKALGLPVEQKVTAKV